jgi:hypothetical protein
MVPTVMYVFFWASAGSLVVNALSATPSGPNSLMPGLAAHTSLYSWTPFDAVMPPKKNASAPLD